MQSGEVMDAPLAPTELDAAHQIAKRLGLPDNFVTAIAAGDGWTFVLKSEALVESAVTYIILRAVADKRLHGYLERRGMSDKLRIVAALDLMDASLIRAATYLLELRNYLAHDARRVRFSFAEYLRDPKERDRFMQHLGYAESVRDLLPEQGQVGAWLAVVSILADVYLADERLNLDEQKRELALRRLTADTTWATILGTTAVDATPTVTPRAVIDPAGYARRAGDGGSDRR